MAVTDTALLEFRLAEQEKKIIAMDRHIRNLETKIAKREEERQREEKRRLVAGIMVLGSVIVTLGGVIWSYRAVIFRGPS